MKLYEAPFELEVYDPACGGANKITLPCIAYFEVDNNEGYLEPQYPNKFRFKVDGKLWDIRDGILKDIVSSAFVYDARWMLDIVEQTDGV